MKDSGSERQAGVVTALSRLASRTRGRRESTGIEVQEEELGIVTAQRLYKLRCGCGRSWFELELPHLIACPACAKRSLVTI
jgi:hypothetical protein